MLCYLTDYLWINIFIDKFNDGLKSVCKSVGTVQQIHTSCDNTEFLTSTKQSSTSLAYCMCCTHRPYKVNHVLVSMNNRMDFILVNVVNYIHFVSDRIILWSEYHHLCFNTS